MLHVGTYRLHLSVPLPAGKPYKASWGEGVTLGTYVQHTASTALEAWPPKSDICPGRLRHSSPWRRVGGEKGAVFVFVCFGVFRRVSLASWSRMRCGRATSCEHVRRRRQSDECGSASICKHGRQRYLCKECGGKGIRRRRHERRRSVPTRCGKCHLK